MSRRPKSTPVAFEPGVFYARDAFEGLDIIDKLTSGVDIRSKFVQQVKQDAFNERLRKNKPAGEESETVVEDTRPSESIQPARTLPTPPFWGPRVLERIGLEDVAVCMDYKTLYRLHWGGKTHGEDFERLVEQDFRPRLERMLREARQQRYLQPRAIYGYYPCQSSGNELIIYDPEPFKQHNTGAKPVLREVTRFHFPRQHERERLCLADYFTSTESGHIDVVALQVVTMGQAASETIQELQDAGNYSDAYFVHGLAVEMAEGLAEYTNRLIRTELGLDEDRGRRYSWGYPAIPDLEDHTKLFAVLPVTATIGLELTDAYQLVPEQSTAAIVVHHQQSSYFAVREAAEALRV